MTPNDEHDNLESDHVHELFYTPELYEDDWVEIDTDQYKVKPTEKL